MLITRTKQIHILLSCGLTVPCFFFLEEGQHHLPRNTSLCQTYSFLWNLIEQDSRSVWIFFLKHIRVKMQTGFRLNLSPIKEPLGFVKIVEWVSKEQRNNPNLFCVFNLQDFNLSRVKAWTKRVYTNAHSNSVYYKTFAHKTSFHLNVTRGFCSSWATDVMHYWRTIMIYWVAVRNPSFL